MKKILFTVLMVMAIVLPVFAALPTTELLLKTEIAGETQIMISESEVLTVSGYDLNDKIEELILTDSNYISFHQFYVSILTNRLLGMDVYLEALPMTREDTNGNAVDTVIHFNVFKGVSDTSDASILVVSSPDGTTSALLDTVATGGGRRVNSFPFRIKVFTDPTAVLVGAYERATEGTYQGTLKVSLVSL